MKVFVDVDITRLVLSLVIATYILQQIYVTCKPAGHIFHVLTLSI